MDDILKNSSVLINFPTLQLFGYSRRTDIDLCSILK